MEEPISEFPCWGIAKTMKSSNFMNSRQIFLGAKLDPQRFPFWKVSRKHFLKKLGACSYAANKLLIYSVIAGKTFSSLQCLSITSSLKIRKLTSNSSLDKGIAVIRKFPTFVLKHTLVTQLVKNRGRERIDAQHGKVKQHMKKKKVKNTKMRFHRNVKNVQKFDFA